MSTDFHWAYRFFFANQCTNDNQDVLIYVETAEGMKTAFM